jgi:hypothetical protein
MVFVAKPPEVPFREALTILRMWLVDHNLRPSAFKAVTAGEPVGFEIGLSKRGAEWFEAFEWPQN